MDPRYKTPTADLGQIEDTTFRNLHQLTTALRWLLFAGAVFAVINLISSWLQIELLSRTYTEAEGQSNDIREAAVGGVSTLLAITTFIVFGRWIVLAHRNLPAMGAQYLEFRPGWAVGWFFVPIANFWKPYLAMRSLWRNSRSVEKPDAQDDTWVLPAWWTLWIVSTIFGNILTRISLRANTVDELISASRITIASLIVDVFLYLVAAVLVQRIWAAQRTQRESPGEFTPAAGFADSKP